MKVVSCLFDKVVPEILFGLLHARLLRLVFDPIAHVLLLFFVEECRDHADGQQVIDQFEESLFEDVGVSEEEENWSIAEHA